MKGTEGFGNFGTSTEMRRLSFEERAEMVTNMHNFAHRAECYVALGLALDLRIRELRNISEDGTSTLVHNGKRYLILTQAEHELEHGYVDGNPDPAVLGNGVITMVIIGVEAYYIQQIHY